MSDPVFSRDVRPITDFKVKSSAIVEHARRTKRPVLITQRGAALLSSSGSKNMKECKRSSLSGGQLTKEQTKRNEKNSLPARRWPSCLGGGAAERAHSLDAIGAG